MRRALMLLLAIVVIGALVLGAQAYAAQSYNVELKVPLLMSRTRHVYPGNSADVSVEKNGLMDYFKQGRSVAWRAEAGFLVATANMTVADKHYQTRLQYDWPNETELADSLNIGVLSLKFVSVEALGNAVVVVTYDVHNQLVSKLDPSIVWWENETVTCSYLFDATAIYESGKSLEVTANYS